MNQKSKSKKKWLWLIASAIVPLLVYLGQHYIDDIFPSQNKADSSKASIHKVDSGSMTHNEVAGNQTYIAGDQINNPPSPAKPNKPQPKAKKKTPDDEHAPKMEQKAEVNNAFMNQGGKNNTYNQQVIVTKPPARQLTNDDKDKILNAIPSKDVNVEVLFHQDQESSEYAKQIHIFLLSRGYKVHGESFDMANKVVPPGEKFTVSPAVLPGNRFNIIIEEQ